MPFHLGKKMKLNVITVVVSVVFFYWTQKPVSMGTDMHLRLTHICTGLLHFWDLFLTSSIVLEVLKVSFAKLILEMEGEYSLHLQKWSRD